MGCQVLYHFLKMVYITCLAILLYFFPSSYIILIYENIRKLHFPLLPERLYIVTTELVRMLSSSASRLPGSSGRCGTALYTLVPLAAAET